MALRYSLLLLIRVRSGVDGVDMCPVVRIWCQRSYRFDVATQLVRHHDAWLTKAIDQAPQEPLCSFRIAMLLHKNIESVTVCVNGAPQPLFLAVDWNDDFIKVPFISSIRSITLDAIGEVASEPVHPKPDGFAADNHASFGKQILHISRAEGKTIIRPNGITDDFSRKAVAFQGSAPVGGRIVR